MRRDLSEEIRDKLLLRQLRDVALDGAAKRGPCRSASATSTARTPARFCAGTRRSAPSPSTSSGRRSRPCATAISAGRPRGARRRAGRAGHPPAPRPRHCLAGAGGLPPCGSPEAQRQRCAANGIVQGIRSTGAPALKLSRGRRRRGVERVQLPGAADPRRWKWRSPRYLGGSSPAVRAEASAAHTGPIRSSVSPGVRPFSPDARAECLAIRAHLRVRRHDGAHLTYFADF